MTPSGMNDMGSDKGPDLMVAIGAEPGATRTGQQSTGPDAGAMNGEDCVPLAALNLPDNTEQMQSPEQGDKVQYTVEGTVTRIEGDNAYIKRDTINGQPVNDAEAEPENPAEDKGPGEEPDASSGGDDSQMADLQQLASKTNLY